MLRNIILASIGFGAVTTAAQAAIVINEAYGGGGNSGSTYKNDFIELYNNGTTAVDVSGYQLSYAGATSAFTPSTNGNDTTAFNTILPSGTSIAPGGFLLIQEAVGAGGTTDLPAPVITDSTPIAMGASAFKIQLLDGATATSTVLDLLGAGATANASETSPAPAPSNTLSSSRKVDGVDTGNNSADFQSVSPTPGAANAVPEPASLALLGLAGLVGLRRRR